MAETEIYLSVEGRYMHESTVSLGPFESPDEYITRVNAALSKSRGVTRFTVEQTVLPQLYNGIHWWLMKRPHKIELIGVIICDVGALRCCETQHLILARCSVVGELYLDFTEGFDRLINLELVGMGLIDVHKQVRFPPNTGSLNLSGNLLDSLSNVEWPVEMHVLNLSENYIKDASFLRGLPCELGWLNLNGNKIEHLDLSNLKHTGVTALYVKDNELTCVYLQGKLKCLWWLVLHNNNALKDIFFWSCDVSPHLNVLVDGCPLLPPCGKRTMLFQMTVEGTKNAKKQRTLQAQDSALLLRMAGGLPVELCRVLCSQYL